MLLVVVVGADTVSSSSICSKFQSLRRTRNSTPIILELALPLARRARIYPSRAYKYIIFNLPMKLVADRWSCGDTGQFDTDYGFLVLLGKL